MSPGTQDGMTTRLLSLWLITGIMIPMLTAGEQLSLISGGPVTSPQEDSSAGQQSRATALQCCRACKKVLPLSSFYKSILNSSGYDCQCLQCRRIYAAGYRAKNRHLITRQRKLYKKIHPDLWKEACKRSAAKFKERFKEDQRFREKVRLWNRNYARKSNAALREEMIQAYGSQCVCCGERIKEFLTLEHIFHDGKKHKKEAHGSLITIYRTLKRLGWPKDRDTILCMNCNFATRFSRPCPHKAASVHDA